MDKIYWEGTHRVRHPRDTLTAIRPLLSRYGITRLADVTGLDDIGIPVVMAVRPLALTLSVSQGKGASLDAARVSGAMEAIEMWHGEHAVPAAEIANTPADDLALPYPVTALEQHKGSLLTDHTRLDWIPARSAVDDTPTLVPRQAVRIGRDVRAEWRIYMLTASSNGLASGNTRPEALIHGLYEVVERDVTSRLSPTAHRQHIDPRSVDDPHCAGLIEQAHAAGAWLELVHLPNRFAIPCLVAYLWREDHAAAMVSGSGAHSDPAVALSRAISEAAQSRLTHIAGSRDDIHPVVYRDGHYTRPRTIAPLVTWAQIRASYRDWFRTDQDEAHWLAHRVATVAGFEPLAIDLTWGLHAREEFSVVKICAPGLVYNARHEIPRPQHREAIWTALGLVEAGFSRFPVLVWCGLPHSPGRSRR
ncbi:MAG: YcaO-like family protein [Sporichthyaceae bacterium]|nr:YcaO-like family protein [Sporichthyaceae bacterium]